MFDRPLGLSAQAIAGYGKDHPWDPSDLLRCMNYCASTGITPERLRKRMAGRSVAWDRLLPEWENLVDLLNLEMATATDGRAPKTYHEMKRVLADGIRCELCDGSGRGVPCDKCRGTGSRSGGRCRAAHCFGGALLCDSCRGRGYNKKD